MKLWGMICFKAAREAVKPGRSQLVATDRLGLRPRALETVWLGGPAFLFLLVCVSAAWRSSERGRKYVRVILTADVTSLSLIECLCASSSAFIAAPSGGGDGDGIYRFTGMFLLLSANALAATPSSPHQTVSNNPLSPRGSAASPAMYC
ncbi:hypothetical protein EYF80_014942 [Liparis tanakae]|uniref:Uncharacterized protein n=1 Tax=Liparis tanakae TaxID=230148 RepID=A0A4Z2IBQ5_9TELE|nr:hypothetical protein EYF80_014942 [Liparis tanakae]